MNEYYKNMELTHEELQAIISRSKIMVNMPRQRLALIKCYADLVEVAEALDQATVHYNQLEEKEHGEAGRSA